MGVTVSDEIIVSFERHSFGRADSAMIIFDLFQGRDVLGAEMNPWEKLVSTRERSKVKTLMTWAVCLLTLPSPRQPNLSLHRTV